MQPRFCEHRCIGNSVVFVSSVVLLHNTKCVGECNCDKWGGREVCWSNIRGDRGSCRSFCARTSGGIRIEGGGGGGGEGEGKMEEIG